jgi:cysteine desulfurase/selenocysteine lyase
MSNVLGTVTDARRIAEIAHERGVPVLVDGCQAAVHMPVNVSEIGADFYVVTGHKLYGPSGSGAVYIHRDRLAEMRPFLGGGDMIREVHRDTVTYNDAPHKFEAGTPNIVQMIGLGAALDYLEGLGMENVAAHETALRDYAQSRLGGLNWLQVHGNSATKGAIFSFSMEGGAHPHDISTIIDRKGVAVRAGHHCAQPLMQHLGVAATARASFGLYNTTEEVDRLVDALELCHELFG